MNSVNLIGRLTRDPELRYTPGGDAVCTFSIAVDRPFNSSDGQTADFPSIVCWKAVAENVANYMKKGRLVGVEGRFQTRRYENNEGKQVYVSEVVASNVKFLDYAKEEPEEKQEQTVNSNNRTGNGSNRNTNNSGNRRK